MTNADQYERYMLTLINADRAKLNLDPLKLELNLNQSAEDHSEWMLATDRFSHTGAGGSSATDRIRDADFDLSGSWRTAENIAVQSERGNAGIKDDVADLHQSLMNSPGHYRNLMNPDLDYIGIGIEFGGYNFGGGEVDSVIVTQNFASTGGKADLDTGASPPPPPPPDTGRVILGTTGADKLTGGSGNDVIKAAQGADFVQGGGGNDIIRGGRDADRLFGNAGQDKIYAGKGNDVLRGGSDADQLFGRKGDDRFVFAKGDDTDTIRDFQNNRDTIDLRSFDFANKAQAMKYADNKGGDVVFDFGGGDRLVIEDIKRSQLTDDLLI